MKTKVIAFRVTQSDYEALQHYCSTFKVKLGDLIMCALEGDLQAAYANIAKERKRLEAKAKRDAKKAANVAE